MPALSDIPEFLLDASQLRALTDWIREQPMPWYDKKHLLSIWSQFTGTVLTSDDYQRAGAHRPD